MESILHNLRTLTLSHHPLIVIETVEENRVDRILDDLSQSAVWGYFDWSLASGLRNRNSGKVLVQPNRLHEALNLVSDIALPGVFWFRDLAGQLDDPLTVRRFREVLQELGSGELPKAIVITGTRVDLDPSLESFAVYAPLDLPGAEELEKILIRTVNGLRKRIDFEVRLDSLQKDEMVRALQGLTANQARQKITYAVVEDGLLCADDIRALARQKAEMLRDGGLLEFCPEDDNHFEIGGFDRLKKWLRRAEAGYSKEAAALNLNPPRGILLVGVQGCGKSLAAKVIARQWKFPLLKLDAGRLFDKYVGESEKNLRKALQLAENLAPCVLWIDEVEKGFSTGSNDSADGGTGKRMLGTFLTWMQENKKPVFLAGTANDLGALPPEFLRKGRFDEVFFVDLPRAGERKAILEIHLRLRNQNPANFDLAALTEASEGFSGAEIEQAVISAGYESIYRGEPMDNARVLAEIRATVPLSVSRAEEVKRLRRFAAGRFVPAN